jgi:hypothetical protein
VTPEQYAALQAAITAQIASYVGAFGKLFLPGFMTVKDWIGFLELLWPAVKQSREESAELARTFYDQQRDIYHPTATNLARQLEPYEFDWFVEDMKPVRKVMSKEQATPDALEMVQLYVARAVETGGRRQIINAVEADVLLDEVTETEVKVSDDNFLTAASVDEIFDRIYAQSPSPQKKPTFLGGKPIRGWARVATGRETCAWCLMLVSRGPVYESARTAGLRLGDSDAVEAIENDTDVTAALNQWHPGCDCKVVPVFSNTQWVGKEAADRALNFWIDASKKAKAELADNPNKKYYSVKERRWLKTTVNRETINQLRQMIDNGEINSSDWAALSAA